MARILKHGIDPDAAADIDAKVRGVVEAALEDIAKRGDAAVREMSVKFDRWDREDYRLSDTEIQDCMDQLSGQALKDIEFAQAQVKNFAEIQKASMQDVEVETLPGVVLGHKNIPVNSVGCYVPGWQISASCISPYVGDHRQGRGRAPDHHMCAPIRRQGRAGNCGSPGHGWC